MRTPELQQHAQFLWFDLASPDPLLFIANYCGDNNFYPAKNLNGRNGK